MENKNTQQLNCRLPPSDFNLFKTLCFLRGLKLNEGLLQAIHLWISQEKNKQLERVKKDESTTV